MTEADPQPGEHGTVGYRRVHACLVIRFDLGSGAPLGEVAIQAAPAGIEPIHHPDGWVGLSEGEGQDAARAWWVRSATSPDGHPTGLRLRGRRAAAGVAEGWRASMQP